MELFWRELNYLISMDHNFSIGGKKLLHIATELKKTEINNNLPFEIIDGDLLEIPRELMKELFQLRQDRAIVLTIMGPQSSGKSTLLNFLFGCDFATSMGRCTRGVYGTYFKFGENRTQFNRFNNCEGIFILDTEGIFGITNETDKKYKDRRDFNSKLILFCLAVSDFVVLNVAGNLDTNVEMNVRLCHQKL
jgi:predicted GTPase